MRSTFQRQLYLNEDKINQYDLYHNDSSLYSTDTGCGNEFLERMLYHSNQTDTYNAVSIIAFQLNPTHLSIT